jgi:hypothetical protein
MKGESPRFE